jgi:predicted O-linked N-acetylglucosamine transferase (SPINDLY family)
VSLDAHLGRLACADLALDTYPYGSGATGSNALWAGVPLITRRGETYVSRMAASQLHAIGLDELVTDDDEGYVQLARALALDGERRQALRQRLWQDRLTRPLFDTARYTRDLERLYTEMLRPVENGARQPIVLAADAT